MGKSKKKRNRKYTGVDAKSDVNLVRVHKVNAIVRSPFKQWLHEHKKFLKRAAIIVIIIGAAIFLIVQAFMAIK